MPVVLIFAMLMLVGGCGGGKQASAKQPSEAEAARRERLATLQSNERQGEYRTLRILGFAALGGGAVLALIWTAATPSRPHVYTGSATSPFVRWTDHVPPRTNGRVIDIGEPERKQDPTPPAPEDREFQQAVRSRTQDRNPSRKRQHHRTP